MDAGDVRAQRFQRVVYAGDVGALRGLFDEHPELTDVVDAPWFHFDSPAIVQAAGARDRALIDALLDLGADPDARSTWENGPYSSLHRCVDGADEKSLALAEHLVERGATIDLHAAAGMGRADVIERILADEPERVSEPGPDGATPLHLARDVEIAALLLDHGAEIDKRCTDHRSTPAMWAAQGRADVMAFLLENGARPDLFMAVILDDVALSEEILEAEPDAIDVRVRFGSSHEHLGHGDKYVWALGGAETPLELARVRDRPRTYAWLLERASASTRLVQASRRGDVAEIDRLLDADPGLLASMAEREVCEALYGSALGARALLERGADPNARDDGPGATALHHAAWRELADVAEALLDGGADASIRDRQHEGTPFGWAHYGGRRGMMALLGERHPPDLVDVSWLGDAERARAILSEDPSGVNGEENGRVSPLRNAAWAGHVEVVRALLEHGADPRIAHPETGKTALDLAREQHHEEIVDLLASASEA